MKHLILVLCSLFAFSLSTQAQADPVSWEITKNKIKSGEYELIFEATIEPHWAIYSQFLESEDGPIATSFTFENIENAKLENKVEEMGQRLDVYDQLFEMNISKYKKTVKFVQRVKIEGKSKISGYLTFMCCNDESCLPPKDVPFEFSLK
ncbi:MAG: hypothetical protein MK212_10830 [Saprospiraceae bacterium]|nr:hypothetical protein [Saprospiraceae bacterium]